MIKRWAIDLALAIALFTLACLTLTSAMLGEARQFLYLRF